jgi:uncharacterized protein YgfB (UPF0149 family)
MPAKVAPPTRFDFTAFQLGDNQKKDLGREYHTSLALMLSGNGTEKSWHVLVQCLNISLLLATPREAACVLEALHALVRTEQRFNNHGVMRLPQGTEPLLRRAIAIHAQHMENKTAGQIRVAMEQIRRKLAALREE